MIVVTGGAGFIGSCIVSRLNQMGHDDIVVVDNLKDSDAKAQNLAGKKYSGYYDKNDFLQIILKDELREEVSSVIHMGACSSTILEDQGYYEKNNFEYTKHIAQWALNHKARFIYASSAATYGDGGFGYKDDIDTIKRLKPLNFYGDSKQKFDLWVLEQGLLDKMAGLKFFNVFGPNEYHKGEMRSVIAKKYQQVVDEGKIGLFKSYKSEYGDGEQQRDFIYVMDAVDVVMFFFENADKNGIFNLGTGTARSWNELAQALFSALNKELHIEYIDMPVSMRDKYQYFTEADMSKLRTVGYEKPFMSLEDAVKDYAQYLCNDQRY